MKIGLFGCGAYGMAISSILIDNNCSVTMWTKFEAEKSNLLKTRKNNNLLKGYTLDSSIKITTDVVQTIKDKDLLIIAIPAAFVRELCVLMRPYIKDEIILIATKGIEQKTGKFMSEIVEETLDTENIAVISGGTFAIDIIRKMPLGLSLAVVNEQIEKTVKKALANNYVKLRITHDIIGVELCGAIKNVIALASGILEGLKANESTKAMLLTEALHDMKEIIDSFAGDKKTVLSFAGFGDLLLTCTSTKSRNYSFGKLIGLNSSEKEIDDYLKNTTVEGVYTLTSIYELLKDKEVSIPIIDLIYMIIINKNNPKELLTFLVEKE